jgi:hypothetical protein
MRDAIPTVLVGLVLGWLAREAWPGLDHLLAAFGLT